MEYYLISNTSSRKYSFLTSYGEQTAWSSSIGNVLVLPYCKSFVYYELHPLTGTVTTHSLETLLEVCNHIYKTDFKCIATFTQRPNIQLIKFKYPELLL